MKDNVAVEFQLGTYDPTTRSVAWKTAPQFNMVTDWGIEALKEYYFADMTKHVVLGTGTNTVSHPVTVTGFGWAGSTVLLGMDPIATNEDLIYAREIRFENGATYRFEDLRPGVSNASPINTTPNEFAQTMLGMTVSEYEDFLMGGGIPPTWNATVYHTEVSSLALPVASSSICDIHPDSVENKCSYENDTLTITNTRSVIFSPLTTGENIRELGWAPELSDGLESALFGIRQTNVTYEVGDQPYVRVSIIRTLNCGTSDGSGVSLGGVSDVEVVRDMSAYINNPAYYSTIGGGGETIPPTKPSFLERKSIPDTLSVALYGRDLVDNAAGEHGMAFTKSITNKTVVAHYDNPFGPGIIIATRPGSPYQMYLYNLTLDGDDITDIEEVYLGDVYSGEPPIILRDAGNNPYFVFTTFSQPNYKKMRINPTTLDAAEDIAIPSSFAGNANFDSMVAIDERYWVGFHDFADEVTNSVNVFDFHDTEYLASHDATYYSGFYITPHGLIVKGNTILVFRANWITRLTFDAVAGTLTEEYTVPHGGIANDNFIETAVVRVKGEQGVDSDRLNDTDILIYSPVDGTLSLVYENDVMMMSAPYYGIDPVPADNIADCYLSDAGVQIKSQNGVFGMYSVLREQIAPALQWMEAKKYIEVRDGELFIEVGGRSYVIGTGTISVVKTIKRPTYFIDPIATAERGTYLASCPQHPSDLHTLDLSTGHFKSATEGILIYKTLTSYDECEIVISHINPSTGAYTNTRLEDVVYTQVGYSAWFAEAYFKFENARILSGNKIIANSRLSVFAYEPGHDPEWWEYGYRIYSVAHTEHYGGLDRVDNDHFITYHNNHVYLYSYAGGTLTELDREYIDRADPDIRAGTAFSRLHYHASTEKAFLVIDTRIIKLAIDVDAGTVTVANTTSLENGVEERCSVLYGDELLVVTNANNNRTTHVYDVTGYDPTFLSSFENLPNVPSGGAVRIATGIKGVVMYRDGVLTEYERTGEATYETRFAIGAFTNLIPGTGYYGGIMKNSGFVVHPVTTELGETKFHGVAHLSQAGFDGHTEFGDIVMYDNNTGDTSGGKIIIRPNEDITPLYSAISSLQLAQSWKR